MSFYKSGKRIGPVVEFMTGGGAIFGRADTEGHVTGDDVIYAYPDFQTLLVGKFIKSSMVAARLAKAMRLVFDDVTGIPIIVPGEVENFDEVFSFDEADKFTISRNPTLHGKSNL